MHVAGGHRRVTVQGYGSRVGSSLCGMCFSIVLLVGAVALLTWNEGHAVQVAVALDEAEAVLVEAPVDRILPENEGKLVHFTGKLGRLPHLTDRDFGVTVEGLALERMVEMYQYEEKQHTRSYKEGGRMVKVTDYSYQLEWSSHHINSNNFDDRHYVNPTHWPVESGTEDLSSLKLGAWRLDRSVLSMVGHALPVDLRDQPLGIDGTAPAALGATENGKPVRSSSGSRGVAPVMSRALRDAELRGNTLYLQDPFRPMPGDVRVTWKVRTASQISVLGQQLEGSIVPFRSGSGHEVLLAAGDSLTAAELLSDARASNSAMTWALRLGGFIILVVGFSMFFGPLTVLPDIIPCFGPMISSLIGLGTCVVSFALALAVASVTIALAWIAQRPILATLLFVLAALPLLGVCSRKKKGPRNNGKEQ